MRIHVNSNNNRGDVLPKVSKTQAAKVAAVAKLVAKLVVEFNFPRELARNVAEWRWQKGLSMQINAMVPSGSGKNVVR